MQFSRNWIEFWWGNYEQIFFQVVTHSRKQVLFFVIYQQENQYVHDFGQPDSHFRGFHSFKNLIFSSYWALEHFLNVVLKFQTISSKSFSDIVFWCYILKSDWSQVLKKNSWEQLYRWIMKLKVLRETFHRDLDNDNYLKTKFKKISSIV